MRHGSLFSGIGGFDLAAEWMGWENIFQVEIDPFCQKVLQKNFPNVKRYGDIKEFKGEAVDILTGGFPCQPFSHAGKRKGESDDRYLWPEYLRIIREIQPAYVVGENVAGLLSMDDGKTFDGILSDLEGEGYETEQFIIPACGVGAWHGRERLWIIAYSHSIRRNNSKQFKRNSIHKRNVSGDRQSREIVGSKINEHSTSGGWWGNESSVGRVANGVPNRVDRLKGLGNAIVPQVAYEIFKAIEKIHNISL